MPQLNNRCYRYNVMHQPATNPWSSIELLLRVARFSVFFAIAMLGAGLANAAIASTPKNVVFLADDLGWATQGVRQNHFYAYPACSPARAAMLTGRSSKDAVIGGYRGQVERLNRPGRQ